MADANRILFGCASEILEREGASAIILFLDVLDEWEVWKGYPLLEKLILVTRREESVEELEDSRDRLKAVLRLPGVRLTRLSQIKLSTVMCLAEGIISPSDKVVCLTGVESLDTLVILDLSKESELITTMGVSRDLVKKVKPEVFETVLNIALELSSTGREGRVVGATFVIGDHARVEELSRPLILNPFKGYPEETRNIMDERLHETIKEFSMLDGAFIIRDDGVIMSAGMHLDAALKEEGLLPGLGSRHMAAAGITDVTDATAITVSASTGVVRIFRQGKLLIELERPARF